MPTHLHYHVRWICFIIFLFFFSSRRRHTRCSRDWSSDVCSSDLFPEEDGKKCPIRTSLVTARAFPAHKRPINTLREWNIRLDESFFLGGMDKGRVLGVLKPHIFFDDQRANLESSKGHLPVAEVPAELEDLGGVDYKR